MMIPHDKALHIIAGILIFAAVNLVAGARYAAAAVAIIAIGKELYDRRVAGHTPSWLDAFATAAGGLLGYICTI